MIADEPLRAGARSPTDLVVCDRPHRPTPPNRSGQTAASGGCGGIAMFAVMHPTIGPVTDDRRHSE
jgi:hypothetical protein